MKLSVVVPIFNEETLLPELKRRLDAVLSSIEGDYEIILVDDGSNDDSLDISIDLARSDPHLAVVQLSRNFGHQQSITAGISVATGDALVVMDGDLEDPPEVIPAMIARWKEGFRVVTAARRSRQTTVVRKLLFGLFHRLFTYLSDFPIPTDTGVFSLMDRSAYHELLRLEERNRFLPGLRSWVGFRSTIVWYDRERRHSGEPKQTFLHLLKYAFDAIFSFSYKPLRLSLFLGLFLFLLSSSYAFVLVLLRVLDINVTRGFTTTTVAILFFGGAILVSNGILGEYLGRIYDEVKRRPLFVIERVIRGGSEKPG